MGIYEVLEVSTAVSNLINENASADKIKRQAIEEGMITMLEEGFMKAIKGATTLEEVLRVTKD